MQSSEMTTSLCFVFQNDLLLLIKNEQGYHLPTTKTLQPVFPIFLREHSLGIHNHVNCYCAEIANKVSLPDNFHFIPLRKAFELLNSAWYQTMIKAFSVINWDKNHHYCGRCANLTTHTLGSFERMCPICGLLVYPRISPSVIVLIQKDDHLLMARSPHFVKGLYGLIAGFVEVGESIEEAIHREVQEEVSLTINNLQYFGSQPWPFPDSLMIGFMADYVSGDIIIDQREIEDAGWYHYAHLPAGPSSTISIARKLIQHFVDKQQILHGTHHGNIR